MFLPFIEHAYGVHDAEHGHARIGKYSCPEGCITGKASRHDGALHDEGEYDVLPGDAQGAAGQAQGLRDSRHAGIEEHHVSRFHSCVSTAAHGSAHIGTSQDWRVVDAIADEQDRAVFLAQAVHFLHLVRWQQLGPHFIDAGLAGNVLSRSGTVTSKHGRSCALVMKGLDGTDSIAFYRIGNDQTAQILASSSDEQLRPVGLASCYRHGDAAALQQTPVAAQDHFSSYHGTDAGAGLFAYVRRRQGMELPFLRSLDDAAGNGMGRVAFHAGTELQ